MIIKSIFVIPIALVGTGLSFWVLLSNKKSKINRLLFAEINLIILSLFFDYLSGYFSDSAISAQLIRFSYAFLIFALITFYGFVQHFPFENRSGVLHKILSFLVLIPTSLLGLVTILTPLVISSAQSEGWGNEVMTGDFITVYYLSVVLLISASFINLVVKYNKSTKADKLKIRAMFIGMVLYVAAQAIFNLLLPLFGVQSLYYLGDYSIIIFIIFTTYAIVKHHLFDLRLAIVRSVTYTLVLITLAAIYLAIAFALSMIFDRNLNSPEQTVSGVAISLVLAFAFQPIKRFFDKTTNKFFYKDNYDAGDFFARLNKTLSVTTDLRNLLERTAYEIGHTLKSEQAFFFINTTDEHYISAGTPHHRQLPKADAVQLEAAQDMKNSSVIVASMLDTDDPVRRLMLSHRIELILPLIQSNSVIGYLCLGDHLTSGYTNRDIKALATISNELIIAIQNALAVEEIRELNATLQQRIANATKELRASNTILRQLDKVKDEFVSMASHQLRTPLTSVKGYLSMVLEGDVGKITDQQRKFLNEAFMSSERMVHLINDFLNVSRLQTGKFVIDKVPTDLSKIVEQEINSLQPNALARKLKYVYKPPKKFPILNIDEGKIRQVIMNFADNALYYSHEDSSIDIGLSIDDNEVLFTVKDTGIGVPVSEQAHLFTKFYRASNARKQRPDGTGVGLFLAKKVVEAHGGKVIFESVEGEGSTFGFRLPIETK
ncbi:MAG: HAMP domain-containing sensor histidine kinase [Candidatus Saccharibacteria bacterium]